MVNIKDLSIMDRPREKLLKYGASNLTDKELLAIILRTGTKSQNVLELAEDILKMSGGVNHLKSMTYNELIKQKGIGQVKAVDILSVIELAKRIFTTEIKANIKCTNPAVVANHFRYKLNSLDQEVFYVLDLDTKGKVLDTREVFKGSLSELTIHPREIFKQSIRNSAASIICLHNHPSGLANPSLADLFITKQLINAGNILQLSILDHIIIAKEGYCSLKEVLLHLEKENIVLEKLDNKTLDKIIKNKNLIRLYQ